MRISKVLQEDLKNS